MTQDPRITAWENHVRSEFFENDADAALAVMTAQPYVNHVPTLTGGSGRAEVENFYRRHFVGKTPEDLEVTPVSRTIGDERIVDELVIRFTHSRAMDYFLPGVEPTNRRIEVAVVVVARFEDGLLAAEHIYWDQASVLVQIGRLDPAGLPVVGREAAQKVLDPSLPGNGLIQRAQSRRAGAA